MKLLLGIGAVVFLLSLTAIEVLTKKESSATQVPQEYLQQSVDPEYRIPAGSSPL